MVSTPPPLPGPTAFRRWRTLILILLGGLLLLVMGIVLRPFLPWGDPVEREVHRLMELVRERDDSSPWAQARSWLREWLTQGPANGVPAPESDPADELDRLGARAHPYLLPLVSGDTSRSVREMAIRVLAGGEATNAWPAFARALEGDVDAGVRASAAEALMNLDPDAAIPLLLAGLERERRRLAAPSGPGDNSWEQSRALDAIARRLGGWRVASAVDPLLEALRTISVPHIQSTLVEALGELEDPRAASPIRELISSPETLVRDSAIRALGQLRDRESAPALMGLLAAANTNLQAGTSAFAAKSRSRAAGFGSNVGAVDWQTRGTLQALGEALGRMGDARATPLLAQAVTNLVEEHELKVFIEAFAALGDPRAVPALRLMLSDHPKVAKEAADALAGLGHGAITNELSILLNAPERDKRVAAAMALANLGDRTPLARLVEAWENGTASDQRGALVEALGIIGDASTVPLLARALEDSEQDIRTQAAWSLGYIHEPASAPALIRSLADTNFQVRFAAAFSLVGLTNREIAPALERLFQDDEPRVRTAAACTLAFLGVTNSVAQLAETLRRNDDWQRMAGAMALLRLNTPEARRLAAGMTTDRDKHLRDLARVALEQGPVVALTGVLRDGTPNHRHYAARMLLFFEDPAALPALRAALRDPRAEVRVAARISIRRLERRLHQDR